MKTELRERLFKTSRSLKRFHAGLDMEMPRGEFFILKKIMKLSKLEGICTVSKIQEDLHMSMPAVSQVLNSLEKKELITRNISTNDRRKVSVGVTATGLEKLDKVEKNMADYLDNIIEKFGEDNTKELLNLLDQLVEITKEMQGEVPSKHFHCDNKGDKE